MEQTLLKISMKPTSLQIDIQHRAQCEDNGDWLGLLQSCDGDDRPDSSAWLDPLCCDDSTRVDIILPSSMYDPGAPLNNTVDAILGWLSESDRGCQEPQPGLRELSEDRPL